jgi:hypothetical protein
LTEIRKMSDGGEELPIFVEGDSLRLDPSNVAVDVAEFEQALRSRDPNDLVQGLALYRGEFLEGLNLQAEPIQEWLVAERRRLRAIAIEGFVQLLEHQQRSGAHKEAPKQDIHYCMTSDGIRIAYAVTGSGPVLVKVATWCGSATRPSSRAMISQIVCFRANTMRSRARRICREGCLRASRS